VTRRASFVQVEGHALKKARGFRMSNRGRNKHLYTRSLGKKRGEGTRDEGAEHFLWENGMAH